MEWQHIQGNWTEFREKAKQQWNVLTDTQLEQIAGNRVDMVDMLQEAYGISRHAAEWQLSGWQQRQHEGMFRRQ